MGLIFYVGHYQLTYFKSKSLAEYSEMAEEKNVLNFT